MRKGGNGDGVSQTGDSGMDDDALAAAMETHFAPFASRSRSVPVPVPHDDPRADAELEGDDEDPEVTAITRRFDRTHDTLGAMNELEQLLIERTGQIPVVTPELLAAHAARPEAAEARPAPEPEPEPTAEPAAEPEAAPEPAVEPAPEREPAAQASSIDWTIETPAPLDPAPGFSPWVDPEAIAAAIDTAPAEFTDVSTKVFAVFSADRGAAEPEPEIAAEPKIAAETEPEAAPPPAPQSAVDDELDGIDDLAESTAEPIVAPAVSEPVETPVPSAQPEAVAAQPPPAADPGVEPESAPQPEEAPRKRRFWPFGRR